MVEVIKKDAAGAVIERTKEKMQGNLKFRTVKNIPGKQITYQNYLFTCLTA